MAFRLLPPACAVLAGVVCGGHALAASPKPGEPAVVAAVAKKATGKATTPAVRAKRAGSSYRPTSSTVPAKAVAPVRPARKVPAAEAAAVAVGVAPESVGFSSQRLKRIGEVFRHEIGAGKLPGAVVTMARRGKVVYQQAWGALDPATKLPMRADALFRIYGLGEPVVVVGALMLVEDGLIQLTDPVAKYLPAMGDVKVLAEAGEVRPRQPVIVHDLMRQTAGFSYGQLAKDARLKKALSDLGFADPLKAALQLRPHSPQDMVAQIARLPLAREPGTAWEVGFGADLLGRVVEAAAGKPLGAFLKERLFEPLGMSTATFRVEGKAVTRLAQPDAGHGLVDVTVVPGNEAAGSGLAMTSADYLRFAQMLLNGGILDGKRVLSPSTVRLMTSDHLGAGIGVADLDPGQYLMGTRGYSFGLGVVVRKADGIAGVPGSAGEFAWGSHAGSFFWVDPKEQLVVVYQTQAPTPDRVHYRRLVKQLVYQAIIN